MDMLANDITSVVVEGGKGRGGGVMVVVCGSMHGACDGLGRLCWIRLGYCLLCAVWRPRYKRLEVGIAAVEAYKFGPAARVMNV